MKQSNLAPSLLPISDSLKISGYSRTYTYELLRKGELKARKVGRRTLIEYVSLQEHMASLPEYRTAGAG